MTTLWLHWPSLLNKLPNGAQRWMEQAWDHGQVPCPPESIQRPKQRAHQLHLSHWGSSGTSLLALCWVGWTFTASLSPARWTSFCQSILRTSYSLTYDIHKYCDEGDGKTAKWIQRWYMGSVQVVTGGTGWVFTLTTGKGEGGRGVCFLLLMYSLKPCFSPCPRSLLLSLQSGPNSLCTRKGFLHSPGLPLEEGWECMAGLTPPWPRPWWGQLVEVNPHAGVSCRLGAAWLSLPGAQCSVWLSYLTNDQLCCQARERAISQPGWVSHLREQGGKTAEFSQAWVKHMEVTDWAFARTQQ